MIYITYDECPYCKSKNISSAHINNGKYAGYLKCNDCGEIFKGTKEKTK